MCTSDRGSRTGIWRFALALVLLTGPPACQGTDPLPSPGAKSLESADAVNERLARLALVSPADREASPDYRIGGGDVLEIDVFQAEELDRTVRVRAQGTISLPLLGPVAVAGKTTHEVEALLAARYGADYLQDPQVSVFVREHQSHRVSVLGEVNDPGLYFLTQPRTLVEMLSQAGGLTEEAGTMVYLRRGSPDAAEDGAELASIELSALVGSEPRGLGLAVRDGDVVYVPKAGVVFVEGAVQRSGAYPLQGAPTVLKALAMAGGLLFEADTSELRLIRKTGDGPSVQRVDLGEVRSNPELDPPILDGDVVVVDTSALKVGMMAFWRGVAGLVSVTTGF